MHVSALVSLISLWLVTRLPDVRLHDAAVPKTETPA